MIVRILRVASLALTVVVAAGWVWFAVDETHAASERAKREIVGSPSTASIDPAPAAERGRERRHGDLHEAVDDANDLLLRPFTGVVATHPSVWVQRSVPALAAILVYGLGLATLARYLQMR